TRAVSASTVSRASRGPISFLLTSLSLRHPSTGRSMRSLVSFRREIVSENGAVFHHEDDFLDRVDILGRIAVDGDNVGKFAGLNRADAIGPIQQFRASNRRCLQSF